MHTANESIRLHWTFFAIAIHRSEPADKYLDFLQNYSTARPHLDPIGTLSVPVDGRGPKGDAFASTYLAHGLQDGTVDQFLDANESILLSAFDATRLIRQPFLDDLQPDFILERADGSHIIGDLEAPGRRHHQRQEAPPRLPRPVQDGAAQLARYAEYFATAENRAFAQTKYGVDVSDPRKLADHPDPGDRRRGRVRAGRRGDRRLRHDPAPPPGRQVLMEYFVYGQDRPGSGDLKGKLTEEHWAFMDGYGDALIARGPTLTEDREASTGSLHIVDLPDVEAARAFAYEEPYYRGGAFDSVLLCRFRKHVGTHHVGLRRRRRGLRPLPRPHQGRAAAAQLEAPDHVRRSPRPRR